MTWDLHTIERSFADAAIEPALWGKAMDAISAETGSVGTILLPPPGCAIPNVPSSETIQRSTEAYFRDGWHVRDERYLAWDTILRRGVGVDLDIINPEKMKRHPYYQEFLRPHNLQYFAGVKWPLVMTFGRYQSNVRPNRVRFSQAKFRDYVLCPRELRVLLL
jgi:hypothetical protein